MIRKFLMLLTMCLNLNSIASDPLVRSGLNDICADQIYAESFEKDFKPRDLGYCKTFDRLEPSLSGLEYLEEYIKTMEEFRAKSCSSKISSLLFKSGLHYISTEISEINPKIESVAAAYHAKLARAARRTSTSTGISKS